MVIRFQRYHMIAHSQFFARLIIKSIQPHLLPPLYDVHTEHKWPIYQQKLIINYIILEIFFVCLEFGCFLRKLKLSSSELAIDPILNH